MKNKIQNSFNKAWKTYDQNSQIQQETCNRAIKCLLKEGNYYPYVADVACGTGLSTESLLDAINSEKIVAIDFCEKLLEVAIKKNLGPRVSLIHADFDEPRDEMANLNLIFCNMGLQWSPDLTFTLELFHSYLKIDGLLIFTLPLEGTFAELKGPYRNSFYTSDVIKSLISTAKFELLNFEAFTTVDHFDNPIEALRSIKLVGSNCLMMKENLRHEKIFRSTAKIIFVKPDCFNLSYRIGIFVLKKEAL